MNLRKVFPKRIGGDKASKVAVEDLCLKIPEGECFGLLGEILVEVEPRKLPLVDVWHARSQWCWKEHHHEYYDRGCISDQW